jgi:hypothetical protein
MTDEAKAVVNQERPFDRIPGLFEQWEIGFMLYEHIDFRIEKGGMSDEGKPLYALFEAQHICKDCREQHQSKPTL